jgi:serine/threonine protein kinase/tetratricopeptide (TPR) repeat protein
LPMTTEGPSREPLIGQTFGHYRITEKIGAGGMGEVYRAHDEHLEREVAIKVVQKRTMLPEDARRLLRKEALTLSKLNHSNIATIYDFYSQGGLDFLVMEFVSGKTLSAYMGFSPLPEKEVATLGMQVAQALEEAHEHGIIHRDLKPANIAITNKGQVKVLDFGLAKLFDPTRGRLQAETLTQSTNNPHVAGTLPYMAPEQVDGKHIDARADIYGLGVVLYQMATGQRPFRDDSMAGLFDSILNRPAVSPRVVNPRISAEMERIILKCVEKEPGNRYQSAQELRIDLQRLLTPSAITPASAVPRRRQGRRAITSIAILPFVNTKADPDTEHFSDGITDTVINSLSQLSKLRVMARSTVFRYKERQVDPMTVGHELNVGAVLTGRLVQRGDNLNISTELVDVTDGTQIWGEQYARKLSDIFSLEEEIITEISSHLCLKLTGSEKKQLTKHPTNNREAYQAYLRGRYMASKYTEDGMRKAIGFFRQAIEIDPAFALSYAGLAMTYWNVSAVQFAPNEVMPKAREAARRALEIDDQLAESHAAVALVKMAYEWDRAEAEREFKLAIQLNPGYSSIYQWHGWHLAIMGSLEESIAELNRALELDPLSEINTYLGLSYYWARQYDQAIEQFGKALELYPDFWLPHMYLGWTYLQQNKMSIAEEELGEAFRLEECPWTVASLAHAAAVHSDQARAYQLLSELEQRASSQFVAPYFVARIYAGLGEQMRAIEWLERAYDARDECLTWLKVDPAMDSLRTDARYPDLLRRVGLSP